MSSKDSRGLVSIVGGVLGTLFVLSYGGVLGFVGGLIALICFVSVMVYVAVLMTSVDGKGKEQ